jgi:hypothetical protein
MSAFTLPKFNHGGVLLNVSGLRDEDETTIERITAADSAIDLFDIFPFSEIELMSGRVDAELDRQAARERYSRQMDNALQLMMA